MTLFPCVFLIRPYPCLSVGSQDELPEQNDDVLPGQNDDALPEGENSGETGESGETAGQVG